MAARITTDQLRNILTRTALSDINLAAQIDNANVFVNSAIGSSLNDESLLEKIELFLAAHFAVIDEERGGLVAEDFDGTSDRYQVISADAIGLNSTRYGRQAIMFDTSGTLARVGRRKASLQALPRTLSRHPDNLTGRG